MFKMKSHPYYNVDAFPDAQQYANWRVKEQMRISALIEHVQTLPRYEGEIQLRVRQGSGFEPSSPALGAKYVCRATVGHKEQSTEALLIHEGGNILWSDDLKFFLLEEPQPFITFEVLEVVTADGASSAPKKGRRRSIVAGLKGAADLGGKVVSGKVVASLKGVAGGGKDAQPVSNEKIIGTGKLYDLHNLWCPPPHYRMHHVNIKSGNDSSSGSSGAAGGGTETWFSAGVIAQPVVGILSFQLQVSLPTAYSCMLIPTCTRSLTVAVLFSTRLHECEKRSKIGTRSPHQKRTAWTCHWVPSTPMRSVSSGCWFCSPLGSTSLTTMNSAVECTCHRCSGGCTTSFARYSGSGRCTGASSSCG